MVSGWGIDGSGRPSSTLKAAEMEVRD